MLTPFAVNLDSVFHRDVAQPGSALAWGARGREFKSRRPDQSFLYLPGRGSYDSHSYWLVGGNLTVEIFQLVDLADGDTQFF
jgi:hypothetical protein